MRELVLAAVVLVLMASGAQASSYLDIYGVIHNPIQNTDGGNHSYAGPNLEPGANLTGANLVGADLVGADLTNADLTNADLTNADLTNADVNSANLFETVLTSAKLIGANLSGTNLEGATLNHLDLSGVNLSSTILFDAFFFHVDMTGADLSYADFTGSDANTVNLSGADLSFATSIDELICYDDFPLICPHCAPCSITYDALTNFTGAGPFHGAEVVNHDPATLGWTLLPALAGNTWGEDWGTMTWGATIAAVPTMGKLGLLVLLLGLGGLATRFIRRGRVASSLLVIGLVLPMWSPAANVQTVVPHTFTDGTPALASEGRKSVTWVSRVLGH
jgi:uncharacterized protein YjbI with pentapeptide repeats